MTSSETDGRTVCTTHTAFVAAPPRAVFSLIADAPRWPYIFPPVVHVERLCDNQSDERLRLWVVSNGAVRNWVSRRVLDPEALRIRFQQESPLPPVETMSGEWVLVPLPGNATSVVLLHEFRTIGDDPGNTALIKQAVDRNSTAELAAVKGIAELGDSLSMLVHSFADSVLIEAPLGTVYEFLYRIQDWPVRLPHVSRLVLDESVPNVQTVEMDAFAADGATRTSQMVRICFPYHSIVYKFTQLPKVMSAHLGAWHLYPTAAGIRATSHNTVMIRPERAGELLGPNGNVELARDLVRQGLRKNCLDTLMHAKRVTEASSSLRTPGASRWPQSRPPA